MTLVYLKNIRDRYKLSSVFFVDRMIVGRQNETIA